MIINSIIGKRIWEIERDHHVYYIMDDDYNHYDTMSNINHKKAMINPTEYLIVGDTLKNNKPK